MAVDMTRRAAQLARYINGIFAFGLMAIRALEVGVFSFQGEGALFVRLFVEQRRLEAPFVMTGLAIGPRGAGPELPFVLVLMAIRAAFKCYLAVEIAVLVAFLAGSFSVFPLQRKFCDAVIEIAGGTIELPAPGDVARFASAVELGFLEAAAVGIHVAVLASAVVESLEKDWLALRSRFVALLAGHHLVFPGKRIDRTPVIEAGSGPPGILLVAAFAIRSLLAPVHVLVAGSALPAKAEERVVQVFYLDLRARAGQNQFRHVTLLAGKGPMFPFESHSGFGRVIETFALQPDEGELFAVMVRMAPRAVGLARGTLVFVRMKARMSVQPALDFHVTFEALKTACPPAWSEVVTGSAFRYAFILLVSVRQWTG
jgi:hypothetical protein